MKLTKPLLFFDALKHVLSMFSTKPLYVLAKENEKTLEARHNSGRTFRETVVEKP